MRPLTLEIEGFTAFRQRTCIDFSELDLFAVTGPTGAGKSSIIDSICYALYGATPRMRDRMVACISPGLERMQVTLTFLANRQRYRVLRETRRKGAGNTRFEMSSADGEWQPLADRAREVTSLVERVVGLDFDAFTRSALLPQGEFQEFLAGTPENRRSVLDKLLRMDVYKRMGVRANQDAQILNGRVTEIERRLREELADATTEVLKTTEAELATLMSAASLIDEQIARLREAVTLAQRLAQARGDLMRQRDVAKRTQVEFQKATELASGGASRLASMRDELERLRRQLEENAYDDELFAALTGAANLALTVERLEKALITDEGAIERLGMERKTSSLKAEEAAKQAGLAEQRLEIVHRELEEAQRHDLAAALQAGLKPGDPCPVCGSAVGELEPAETDALTTAQAMYEAAREEATSSRRLATETATKSAVLTARIESATEQLAEKKQQLSLALRELESSLPGVEDRSLPVIQSVLDFQKQAREERNQLQKQESLLSRSLEDEEKTLRGARERLSELDAECKAAAKVVQELEERTQDQGRQLAAMAIERGWSRAAADLDKGQDPQPSLESLLNETKSRQNNVLTTKGRLEERIHRLESDIKQAETLRKELSTKKAEHDLTYDLAQMLRADRFQAYVQREALRSLAEGGSRRLLELSAGRYELEVAAGGQDFVVKDKWNADDLRGVRTLSGGETFLASLALALALAETLPGLAPGQRLALDSIFLDEGFGSLDPEALDRAAEALDALRMEDRLVCVVTHLQQLAERMPAQIVVHKAEDGSTVSIA